MTGHLRAARADWGHSGCPIVNDDGGVVALHNSWDDDNGQRHAVPLAQMRAFVASTELLPADDGDEVEVIDERADVDEDDDVQVVDGPDDLAPLAVRLAARQQHERGRA